MVDIWPESNTDAVSGYYSYFINFRFSNMWKFLLRGNLGINFSIWIKENFRSSFGRLCYKFRSSVIVFGLHWRSDDQEFQHWELGRGKKKNWSLVATMLPLFLEIYKRSLTFRNRDISKHSNHYSIFFNCTSTCTSLFTGSTFS